MDFFDQTESGFKGCFSEATLSLWVTHNERLTPYTRDEIASHVKECPPCYDTARTLHRQFDSFMDRMPRGPW